MNSVASSSSSPPVPDQLHHYPYGHRHRYRHRNHPRFQPPPPVPDRIIQALRHYLHLLHRAGSSFYVVGGTGIVYIVNIAAEPTCTCHDPTHPCKHILFVFVHVLGVSVDDLCIRRRKLRPWQRHHLLNLPTLSTSVAGAHLRTMFYKLFFSNAGRRGQEGFSERVIEMEDGTTCPVCLEEMRKGEKVVACETCRNHVHEECLVKWKKSCMGRNSSATCVICRATWKDDEATEQEDYMNLSAYM